MPIRQFRLRDEYGNSQFGGGGAQGVPAITCCQYSAVDFYTNSAYLSHAGTLDGIANSNKFFLSFWVKLTNGTNGSDSPIIYASGGIFIIRRFTNNKIRVSWVDNGLNGVTFESVSTFIDADDWTFIMISVNNTDYANPVVQISFNNTVETAVVVANAQTSSTIPFATLSDWFLNPGWLGDMASFFFKTGVSADLNSSSFRKKFINSSDDPVCPGAFGQNPFGSLPEIYMYQPYGDTDAATFNVNNGTGGAWLPTNSTTISILPPPTGCVNMPGAIFYPGGSNNYLARGGNLTGVTNSNCFLASVWLTLAGNNNSGMLVFGNSATTFWFFRQTDNKFAIFVPSADNPGEYCWIYSNVPLTAGGQVHHIMVSLKTYPTYQCQFLVDGILDNGTVFTNFLTPSQIDASGTDWYAGYAVGFGYQFYGRVGELWANFSDTFFDLSVSANVEKFRKIDGTPANLGVNGQLPTGVSPAVYIGVANSKVPLATATVNKGGGGGLTEAGSVAVSPLFY